MTRSAPGCSAGITAAEDDAVRGVVIVGDGKGFCGGADLRQFGTPAAAVKPSVSEVFDQIQALRKPVVAAIHGFALGGGLELALVCNYRIAQQGATIGLPEVNVGLLPGAGGTQRLPRLIGTARGAAHDPERRHRAGCSRRRTRHRGPLCGRRPPRRRTGLPEQQRPRGRGGTRSSTIARRRAVTASTSTPPAAASARAPAMGSRNSRRSMPSRPPPPIPIDEGLALERAAFVRLVDSPEAKALRHVFFAEKEAAKVSDIDRATAPRPINRIAVIGAGTMGTGIAMAFANGGFAVDLIEQNTDALDRGVGDDPQQLRGHRRKGTADRATSGAANRVDRADLELGTAARADLVVEAVFEDMAVKKEVFAKLDALCKPGAVLASNTSRLDIDELARSVSRPQDVIGLHFFSPANVMKLLEVVRGDATADDVVVTSLALAQKITKVPVLSKVCDGFIGNRMLSPYRREADFLLEEGTTPERIDSVLRDFGLAMGPFAMSDLAGLDIGWAARKRLAPTRPKHLRYSRVADVLCESGRFGQKTARATSGTRTAAGIRCLILWSIRSSCAAPQKTGSNAGRSVTPRSSTGASSPS